MKSILFLFFAVALFACSAKKKYNEISSSNSAAQSMRTISFSGFEWYVRDSNNSKVGPGGNKFSNSNDNVWLDNEGKLHLKLVFKNGVWYCSEVRLLKSLGYGTYTFHVNSDLTTIDDNAVIGMFSYLDDNNEIDIEFSKWGIDSNSNAQFVVQPADKTGNIERFTIDKGQNSTQHSFEWRENFIRFESKIIKKDTSQILHEWRYTGESIPKESGERLKLNLWLFKSQHVKNLKKSEVVIDSITFSP